MNRAKDKWLIITLVVFAVYLIRPTPDGLILNLMSLAILAFVHLLD